MCLYVTCVFFSSDSSSLLDLFLIEDLGITNAFWGFEMRSWEHLFLGVELRAGGDLEIGRDRKSSTWSLVKDGDEDDGSDFKEKIFH